jgi:hypothetical protein
VIGVLKCRHVLTLLDSCGAANCIPLYLVFCFFSCQRVFLVTHSCVRSGPLCKQSKAKKRQAKPSQANNEPQKRSLGSSKRLEIFSYAAVRE